MWMYDSQTLRFLAVSDSAISRYGYGREEFLQMRITDIRPPEDVANLRRILEQRSQGLRKSGSVRHRFKNGVVINVRITSLPTQLESRDAILVIAEDITGDERATAALKESEERFRSAFEHAAIGMLITALKASCSGSTVVLLK
jgi:PAS domain S-box-containing protein